MSTVPAEQMIDRYSSYRSLPLSPASPPSPTPARPGLSVEQCVTQPLKPLSTTAFVRLHEILTARSTAEPIYELKCGFSHHSYLCAEHVQALRTVSARCVNRRSVWRRFRIPPWKSSSMKSSLHRHGRTDRRHLRQSAVRPRCHSRPLRLRHQPARRCAVDPRPTLRPSRTRYMIAYGRKSIAAWWTRRHARPCNLGEIAATTVSPPPVGLTERRHPPAKPSSACTPPNPMSTIPCRAVTSVSRTSLTRAFNPRLSSTTRP